MKKIWDKLNEKHFIQNKILILILIFVLISSSSLIYKTMVGVQPAVLHLERIKK